MSINRSIIIQDNESCLQLALEREDYVSAFLLAHALVESLLRAFLSLETKIRFDNLIEKLQVFFEKEVPGTKSFIEELRQFNRRRNRIVHNLWAKGFTFTNRETREAAIAAVITYSLLIEFLQTFDPDLDKMGFGGGS